MSDGESYGDPSIAGGTRPAAPSIADGWLRPREERVDGDPYLLADEAAGSLRQHGFDDHDVVLVLGSGWQGVADAFGPPVASVEMGDVPGFRPPTAEGHGTSIVSVQAGGQRVLVLQGRTHLYEGHGPAAVVHGIRTARRLGCSVAVLTNANGALRSDWQPGECMLIRDHLNLAWISPLVGARFVDLTDAYSVRLRELAKGVHPDFREGVYAMLPGPHYETTAEAKALATLGADAVGMSTVLETIAARECEMEVLALSMITVVEGADTGIDPTAVVAQAAESSRALGPVLGEIITRLGESS